MEAKARRGLARLLAAWRVRTLPTRIILSVFSTALVTSLVVSWTSTRSIESFLRAGIDQKFPAILQGVRERIELWHRQRQLDVEVFARSDTLVQSLAQLATGSESGRAEARAAIAKYLDYVRERFPQYTALFLLDPASQRVAWVGDERPIPDALQASLRAGPVPRAGRIQRIAGERFQLVSSPVEDGKGRVLGSLHALLSLDSFDQLLDHDGLGEQGRIAIVGADGSVLAPAGEDAARLPVREQGRAPGEAPRVGEYVLPSGERVIASGLVLADLGVTLWVAEPYDAAFAPVVALIGRVLAVNLAIVLVFGALAFWIARSSVRPIYALSRAALAIAGGAEEVEIPLPPRRDEIGVLALAFRQMMERLRRKNVELQGANEILMQLSITDGLTSLHNHRAFHDELERRIRRARRTGQPLCLVLLDVDDFKTLNDRHGHTVGDHVLRRVAERMLGGIGDDDFLARYGGEEFALLASAQTLEEAVTLGEQLRAVVGRDPFPLHDAGAPESIRVTVSVGVAALGRDVAENDGRALFIAADRALYEAKLAGKDCVVAAPD